MEYFWKYFCIGNIGTILILKKLLKYIPYFSLQVRDSSRDYRRTSVLKMINVAYTKLDP